MPKITLNKKQAEQLKEFCIGHNQTKFFLAKDEGVYVGAATEKENCIFYFRGYDPNKNSDWFVKQQAQFGGDDFSENIPVDVLDKPGMIKMDIIINYKTIRIRYYLIKQ
ncbi:MAG: DUF3085 domain-containing protein [bacterium]